jgi:hypothetical protein
VRGLGRKALVLRLIPLVLALLELRSLVRTIGDVTGSLDLSVSASALPVIGATLVVLALSLWLLREAGRGLKSFLLASELIVAIGLAGHFHAGVVLDGAADVAYWLPIVLVAASAAAGASACLWLLIRASARPPDIVPSGLPPSFSRRSTQVGVVTSRLLVGCRAVRGPPLRSAF